MGRIAVNRLQIDFKILNEEIKNSKKIRFDDVEYRGVEYSYGFTCLNCNYIGKVVFKSAMRENSRSCPECFKKELSLKRRLKLNTKETNEKLLKQNRNFELLPEQEEKYVNNSTKLLWHCFESECNTIWEASYNNIMGRKRNCPKCKGKKLANQKRLIFNTEKTNEKIFDQNIEFLPNQEYKYKNNTSKLLCYCKICENIWEISYSNAMRNRGCPKCAIRKISGKNSSSWRGGIKHGDYPEIWYTGKIQILIRDRDKHTCKFPDCDYNDKKNGYELLSVHHIDGNKKNCEEYNLISLCRSHHGKVERNNPRSWEDYFYKITNSYEL